ncbi:MAG: AI-2E family transporter [Acidimicrobiales bacterium]
MSPDDQAQPILGRADGDGEGKPRRAARPADEAPAADAASGGASEADDVRATSSDGRLVPRWVVPAVVIFWGGFLGASAIQFFWGKLSGLFVLLAVSVFLSLAIEPGVNRLARRGWRRGSATALILFGVMAAFLVFVGAIGTLVGSQIADLLQDSESYISDSVDTLNDTFGTNLDAQAVIDDFNDPDGAVQGFVADQQDNVVRLSVAALAGLLQLLSVLLFTFYLVAEGPKLRRAICSRLTPARQERVLGAWELAGTKTGGYLYSRALLALLSAVFHWIVFQSLGTAAPLALALWVGIISQFLPVVGTYLAGVLPVLLTFLDSPLKAVIVVIAIVVYQQIENYLFSPRITAHTMELHPALAFGAALGGAAVLGAVGAVLALPAAAMGQAIVSEWGDRHQVIKNDLTEVRQPQV